MAEDYKSTANLWQINSEFVARDLLLISGPGESHKLPGSYKSTVHLGLQINSKSRDLLLLCAPGETHKLPGSYKSTVNSGAANQQQIPGFAVDLWARNLLLICGFLMKSYKSTANSGPQINSKSRDLLLICGPGETHKGHKSTANPGICC